jgi:hypothetical protein
VCLLGLTLIALSHKQGGKSLTPEGYAPMTQLFLWFYTVTSSKDRKTLRPSQVPAYYYSTVQQQVKRMNSISPLTLPCDYLYLVPATAKTPLRKFPALRKATVRFANVCLHARSPVRLHGIPQSSLSGLSRNYILENVEKIQVRLESNKNGG